MSKKSISVTQSQTNHANQITDFLQSNRRFRQSLGTVASLLENAELLHLQQESFDMFIGDQITPDGQNLKSGIYRIFDSIFPIVYPVATKTKDTKQAPKVTIEFGDSTKTKFFELDTENVKFSAQECRTRGTTYAAKLSIYVTVTYIGDNQQLQKQEQKLACCDLPLMTDQGSFIFNGRERVIIHQLHRSAGFTCVKKHDTFISKITPYQGSWLSFFASASGSIFCEINSKRKMPASIFLKAMGFTQSEILRLFYPVQDIYWDIKTKQWFKKLDLAKFQNAISDIDIKHPEKSGLLVAKNTKPSKTAIRILTQFQVTEVPVPWETVLTYIPATDIVNNSGAKVLEQNAPLSKDALQKIGIVQELTDEIQIVKKMKKDAVKELEVMGSLQQFSNTVYLKQDRFVLPVLYIDNISTNTYISNTLALDAKIQDRDQAILEIFKKAKPGEAVTKEKAEDFFNNTFFNGMYYDFSATGRLNMNQKLDAYKADYYALVRTIVDEEFRDKKITQEEHKRHLKEIKEQQEPANFLTYRKTLLRSDVVASINYLVAVLCGMVQVDDAESLSNNRVRSVIN
jgi:DNA-directed RNA polymerase subunit beta